MTIVLPNESLLLREVADGNQMAFHDLMLAYKDYLYTVCLRTIQHSAGAEDCVQDIFLKLWMHREKLVEVENFGGWLNTITRNTLLTALKKKAKERAVIAGRITVEHAEAETVEDLLTQKHNAQLLHAAVQNLSHRQQEVWKLVKEEGLKREEAAERLQVSPDTVKFHLSEAYKRIRTYLIEHGDITLVIMIALGK